MKTSVCEFLRQQTQSGWCYFSPNLWVSDGMKFRASRSEDSENIFEIYDVRNGRTKVVAYFESEPSAVVRDAVKLILQSKKKKGNVAKPLRKAAKRMR